MLCGIRALKSSTIFLGIWKAKAGYILRKDLRRSKFTHLWRAKTLSTDIKDTKIYTEPTCKDWEIFF